jgi:hypothetical protein
MRNPETLAESRLNEIKGLKWSELGVSDGQLCARTNFLIKHLNPAQNMDLQHRVLFGLLPHLGLAIIEERKPVALKLIAQNKS